MWASSSQTSPSPWDTSPHIDSRTHSYLVIGMLGAVLSILLVVFSVFMLMTMPLFIGLVNLISLSLGWLDSVLWGIGFLGLSVKYDEKYARYAFYAYIVDIFVTMATQGLFSLVSLSQTPEVVLAGTGLLSFVADVVLTALVVLSLWRIRGKSNHNQIVTLAAASNCGYVLMIPLATLVVVVLGLNALIVVTYGLNLLIDVVMLTLFYLESRVGVKSTDGSW